MFASFRPQGSTALVLTLALIVSGAAAPLACARDVLAAADGSSGQPATLPSFRLAAERIGPSVVNVSSSRHVSLGQPQDELLGRLFRIPQPQHRLQRQSSLGSGVIVSEQGHVLTNNHVVEGAEEVRVTLADGRSFDARVVGRDPPTDVAVLAIDAQGLEPARFADSDVVRPGDWVVAVGNPFGLGHTVTAGIISAVGRSGVGVARYEDFLQTDAAINPGNSGGPLVDLEGRVVGINTAIASRSGGFMGVGFAIPAVMAQQVMQDLIQDGRVARGWLGVLIQDLSPELAESFDYPGQDGVLVSQVLDGSPAQEAGLQVGDIIMRLEGRSMTSANKLAVTVASLGDGADASLDVFREGESLTLEARIRESRDGVDGTRGPGDPLGLAVEDVRGPAGERGRGARVTAVEPGSLAARIGVSPGDVVLSLDGQPVEDARAYSRLAAGCDPTRGVRLLIDSQGQRRFLLLRGAG